MEEARRTRVAELIGAVALQALHDWSAERIVLLDDGSPEAELAAGILRGAVGSERLQRADGGLESEGAAAALRGAATPERLAEELRRMRARLVPRALVANPANKTALLLGGPLPPDPLMPLGDLYASDVASLAGAWSAPPSVRVLAERAGGIDRLDDALRARIDRRDPHGLRRLAPDVWPEVEAALRLGAASRTTLRLVPKLGFRTLGADLFE